MQKQTKLSLSALYLLHKNGLVSDALILRHPYTKNNIDQEIIKQTFIAERVADVIFGLFLCLMMFISKKQDDPVIIVFGFWPTFILLIRTGYQYLSQRFLISDLKKLHWIGFNGYYKLHWDMKKLHEFAEYILENNAQGILNYENIYRYTDERTNKDKCANKARLIFKKKHAIFLKFNLCNSKQSVYFERFIIK